MKSVQWSLSYRLSPKIHEANRVKYMADQSAAGLHSYVNKLANGYLPELIPSNEENIRIELIIFL